jgi:hypothetical protein
MKETTLNFQVGDRVYTERFGAGTVIGITSYLEMGTLVQFDTAREPLHSGLYKGKELSCWWFYSYGEDEDNTKIVLVIRKKADNG